MIAGALEIQLLTNLAQLSKDMQAAKSMVGGALREIDKAIDFTKKGLEALGLGFGLHMAAEFVKQTNEATAAMKDLGIEAGTTAEKISRFEQPARTAGSSLDAVATAIFRMSKAAVEARDPTSKAALALDSIGISARDLKNLKPDEMFELVARKLDGFSNGIQKNAVMQELFNRSGKEMSKVVHAINEQQQLAATVTNEQAEQANKLTSQIVELKMQSEAFWRGLVASGVPALNDILRAFLDSRKEVGLWQSAIAAASVAWESIFGKPGIEQQQRELSGVNEQITAIREWQAATQDAFVTESSRNEQAARLNQLLERRAQLEAMIHTQELDAQDARAVAGLAGAGGKPDPNYDPNAAARANVFRTEMAQLDQEMAKLKGVGELEAYVAKLGEDRYKLLSKEQKDDLVQKEKEIIAYRQMLEANQMILKSEIALIEAQQRRRDLEQDLITKLRDSGQEREFELTLIGRTAEEQEKLRALHELDLELKKQIAALDVEDGDFLTADQLAQIERITKIIELEKQRTGALIDQKQHLEEHLAFWGQIGDAAGRFFGDLITNGKSAFENLRQEAKRLLSDLIAIFIKRWVLNMAAGGSVGGSAAEALSYSSGGGSGSSLLGTGVSLAANYGAQALGYTGIGTVAEFYGAATGAIPAAAIGADAVAAGVGVDTVAAGVGEYAAAAIPYIGWVIAAAALIYAAFGHHGGGPKGGGSFGGTFSGAGDFLGASPIAGTQDGRLFTPNQADAQVQTFVQSIGQGFGRTLASLGGTSGGVNFGLGFDTDPHGRAPDRVSSVVSDLNGNILYQNINQNTGDSLGGAMSLEAQRMILAALQASTLPTQVADILNTITAQTATADQIQAVIAAATEMANVIKALPDLGLNIDIAGLQAFQQSGESIGQTFMRLAQIMASFDDQFMTDAQKFDRAQKQVTDGFAALGVAVPASRTEFYNLVHGLDLTTEAGRAMFTALMALAPAFLVVDNAIQATANAVTDAAIQMSEAQAYILTGQSDFDMVVQSRELAKELAAVKAALRDWLQGLLTSSSLSPLSPEEQLAAAQKEYQRLLGLAQGGDLDAARQLQGAGNTYLQIARQLFGSSSGYVSIFEDVFNSSAAFAGVKDYNGQMLDIQQQALAVHKSVDDTLAKIRQESREDSVYIVNEQRANTDRIVDALTVGGADRR